MEINVTFDGLKGWYRIVPKLRPPLRGGLQTFGHYGTRVRCQNLAPRGGLNLVLHGIRMYLKILDG
jgi:hypothetical protein